MAEHQLGQERGLAGWLDDGRYAREQVHRKLLEHAPDREVEGVDVHGHAFQRRHDVLADKAAGLAHHFRVAIDDEGGIR